MGNGTGGLNTSQKKEQAGAPFAAGSAINGTSLDASGKIVLGEAAATAGNPSQFLSDRYLLLKSFALRLRAGAGNAQFAEFLPATFEFIIYGTAGNFFDVVDTAKSAGTLSAQPTVGINTSQVTDTNGNDGQDIRIEGAFVPVGVSSNYSVIEIRKGVSPAAWTGVFRGLYYNPVLTLNTSAHRAIETVQGNVLFGTSSTDANRGKVGIRGVTAPTAFVHIGASNGAAGSAPIKLDAGGLLAAPENNAIENDGSQLYYTDNSGNRLPVLRSPNISNKIAAYNVLATDCGKFFTNSGAAAGISFNLPAAAPGLVYEFCVLAAFTLTINATGGAFIRLGSSLSVANGSASASALGSTIRIVCVSASLWVIASAVGSWTIT